MGWARTLFLAGLLLLAIASQAHAQVYDLGDEPALIQADQIIYEERDNLVTAEGNVEIAQGDRVVLADRVSYQTQTGVVTAQGHVTLIEPNGDLVFADELILTDDLSEGFIRDIRVLLSDQSRLAAVSGTRTGDNRTEFTRAVFSPCELCENDPEADPLWQLKAIEVVHDQESHTIVYHDAWLEFYGLPIFYTPYFEHPDPTVERKSGFLAPTFGSADFTGSTVQVPYFWNIAPTADLTLAPIFTQSQGVVGAGTYRQLFTEGRMEIEGSGTIADREDAGDDRKDDQFRGHIDAWGRFNLSDTARLGIDVERTTDDTYLRLYGFSSQRTLTSSLYVEDLNGRDYFLADSSLYQGLRLTDDQDQLPIIAPDISYSYVSEPQFWNSIFRVDASALNLTRIEGRDVQRASFLGAWELPIIDGIGEVWNFSASLQADGYSANGHEPGNDDPTPASGGEQLLSGRVFPRLVASWRYPWASHFDSGSAIFEPSIQGILAPNGGNPNEIPNEDSLDFEFDDTNLFSFNRFAGIDRIDPGSRVDYGAQWSWVENDGSLISFFVGQSLRASDSSDIPDDSGLENDFSDLVGRVEFNPVDWIDMRYRFRFDAEDREIRRNELDMDFGPEELNLDLRYTFIENDKSTASTECADREEVDLSLSSQFTDNWSAFVRHQHDLTTDEPLLSQVGLKYQDECFLIEGVAERNFFSDRDIAAEDAFYVRVVLKHLGEFGND